MYLEIVIKLCIATNVVQGIVWMTVNGCVVLY